MFDYIVCIICHEGHVAVFQDADNIKSGKVPEINQAKVREFGFTGNPIFMAL